MIRLHHIEQARKVSEFADLRQKNGERLNGFCSRRRLPDRVPTQCITDDHARRFR